MHTAGHRIDVEGARLHVETQGPASGRELLFLHGGGTSLDDWDPLTGAFDDCRCVLLDSRGHGASTLGTRTLDYPLLARDAAAVMARLGMRRPVVVGHSDGGIAALHLAARGEVPIAGLVTIGAHASPPHDDIMRDIFDTLTADRWRARFPDAVALYGRLNPEPDFDRLFHALVAMWRNRAPGNYPSQSVTSISCPALIIGGDDDHLVPRGDTLELAAAIEGARLGLIPFGSHVPHLDAPDTIAAYIRRFLEDLEDRERTPAR
ncbi:alpha/beta hydrolase [Luteimonas sp. BDR2-5]|uniref:alpha/beta fold hydrolase n=1 Tax=Proluteimonas luteida TaxID=2878685 RepID=UPI001E36C343|nr:alpha/beta hydrolase [Luteimonas sp. BDR2-5]MCD9028354.1 alpha/beta hydrolase [Luteimonas sp. BDR2-5]